MPEPLPPFAVKLSDPRIQRASLFIRAILAAAVVAVEARDRRIRELRAQLAERQPLA